MPVVGTYSDNIAFDKVRIRLMCRDTANESLDKLQELIRDFTPRDTGHLWESVKKSGPKRVSSNIWEGKVSSGTDYTAAIEYGMAPRKIEATKKQALSFYWKKHGIQFVGKSVNWPGYMGHHMFQRGSDLFERHYAEDIAEGNARIWLGSVDAGRRTIVI